MLGTILRGSGFTRSKIEAFLAFTIGGRKYTAIGYHIDKYGIGGSATGIDRISTRGSARKWAVVSEIFLFCVNCGVKAAACREVFTTLHEAHSIADIVWSEYTLLQNKSVVSLAFPM